MVRRNIKKKILFTMAMCMFILCSPVMQISTKAASFNLNEYYYIASALDENMVLDVSGGSNKDGANIQLYRRNGSDAQAFKIVESEVPGYYYIVNKGSGKVLDLQAGGTVPGTNVQLYQKNGTAAQHWQMYISIYSREHVTFKARCGYMLDVCNGDTKNGTNIWIYPSNGTKSQAFKPIPFEADSTTTTISYANLDVNRLISSARRNLGKTGSQLGYTSDWCAYYVSDILRENGISIARGGTPRNVVVNTLNKGIGVYYSFRNANVQSLLKNGLKRSDLVIETSRSNVTPKPGDIILYLWTKHDDGVTNWSHIGFVVDYNEGSKKIKTIEGNWSGKVSEKSEDYDREVVGILRLVK